MAERREYINRKNAAIFQDKQHPTIMSIIIDGMDQSSCTCPFVGTQNGFVDPFPMHFTGVKEHGQHVTLYRTVGTVSGKSPDLTIYCILHQLEKWVWRNQGRYPEKLYVQLDGGIENANHYVLAILELLAIKRVRFFKHKLSSNIHVPIYSLPHIIILYIHSDYID